MMHTEIEFDNDPMNWSDTDEPPSTQRTPGSGKLVIEDRSAALFLSATWQLVAEVTDVRGTAIVISRSSEQPQAHTGPFTKRWARQVIRTNQKRLRKLGVDVDSAYLRWGGLLEDLEETG